MCIHADHEAGPDRLLRRKMIFPTRSNDRLAHATFLILFLTVGTVLSAQTPTLQFSSTTVPTGNGPRSAILIDLDRDGHRDLAVANIDGSTISLLFGDSSGTFTLQDSLFTLQNGPHAIAAGDFNEDGIVDAVTANKGDHTVALFIGDGRADILRPLSLRWDWGRAG